MGAPVQVAGSSTLPPTTLAMWPWSFCTLEGPTRGLPPRQTQKRPLRCLALLPLSFSCLSPPFYTGAQSLSSVPLLMSVTATADTLCCASASQPGIHSVIRNPSHPVQYAAVLFALPASAVAVCDVLLEGLFHDPHLARGQHAILPIRGSNVAWIPKAIACRGLSWRLLTSDHPDRC